MFTLGQFIQTSSDYYTYVYQLGTYVSPQRITQNAKPVLKCSPNQKETYLMRQILKTEKTQFMGIGVCAYVCIWFYSAYLTKK